MEVHRIVHCNYSTDNRRDMKFHLHIPELEQLALDAASEGVVVHGKQGLSSRSMPRPVYYRCISTFAGRHSKNLTPKKIYLLLRRGGDHRDLRFGDYSWNSRTMISMLDHVVIDDSTDAADFRHIFYHLNSVLYSDIAGVSECLCRLAARCCAKHELLIDIMSLALETGPTKPIRDVIMHYGGRLDPNAGDYSVQACRCGMHDVVRELLSRDRGLADTLADHYIEFIIESGDAEMVTLLVHAVGERQIAVNYRVSVRHFTVQYCEKLLSLGVIRSGTKRDFWQFWSIDVIKFLVHRNMCDMTSVMLDIASHAVREGSIYIDILHRLVEQEHVPVPNDILARLDLNDNVDLGVVDYLVSHGADIHAIHDGLNAMIRSPMLLRYWLDNGLVIQDTAKTCYAMLKSYICRRCNLLSNGIHSLDDLVRVLERIYGFDVKTRDHDGNTLLHVATELYADSAVSILVKHGIDVNAINNDGQAPIHVACIHDYSDTVLKLIDHGAIVNMYDKQLQTPLHYACQHPNPDAVEALLIAGALTNLTNGDDWKPINLLPFAGDDDAQEINEEIQQLFEQHF